MYRTAPQCAVSSVAVVQTTPPCQHFGESTSGCWLTLQFRCVGVLSSLDQTAGTEVWGGVVKPSRKWSRFVPPPLDSGRTQWRTARVLPLWCVWPDVCCPSVRPSVRVCVCACVRACVRACVLACISVTSLVRG